MCRLLMIILFIVSCFNPTQAKEEYYLQWDSDHTAREIKPQHPVTGLEVARNRVYKIVRDDNARIVSIQFFSQGRPSEASNFGAHEMRIHYKEHAIERQFYSFKGDTVANNQGAVKEVYELSEDGFYSMVSYLGQGGEPLGNRFGASQEIIVERDEMGRRKKIMFLDLYGAIIPDTFNGFTVTAFSYDEKNHVTSRNALNENGHPTVGKQKYHEVRFAFDDYGNRTMESFHDLEGKLMIPEGDTFAKIEIDYLKPYGLPNEVRYYMADNQFRTALPALSKLYYDQQDRLIRRTYHDQNLGLMNNRFGVATYVYRYDEKGQRQQEAYDAEGLKTLN